MPSQRTDRAIRLPEHRQRTVRASIPGKTAAPAERQKGQCLLKLAEQFRKIISLQRMASVTTQPVQLLTQPVQLLLTARQSAQACGVSLATWWRWRAAGRVPPPVRVGGCVRWRADELRRWIEADCPQQA